MRKRAPNAEDEEEFEFPAPPQYIEPSILREAEEWIGLDDFDALGKLEELARLEADKIAPLLPGVLCLLMSYAIEPALRKLAEGQGTAEDWYNEP